MTIYVDSSKVYFKGKYWCHMMADSLDELHSFCQSNGIAKIWFHENASYPHYDITTDIRNIVIRKGAVMVSRQEIINFGKLLKKELDSSSLKQYSNKQGELF